MSTALLTDMYELTMLDAWIAEGRQDDPAVFEVFTRRLAPGHRYGVVAGTGRVLSAITSFHFTSQHLDWLGANQIVSPACIEYLKNYSFTGKVKGYPEGSLYFPNSPVLQIHGKLADVLLETVVLSIMNHDSSIAASAARMVQVAGGRPIIEMGSRRTHESSAVAVARSAYIAGFAATSNLEAGLTYGVPVKGTAAHAFTLSHKAVVEDHDTVLCDDTGAELRAFTSQVNAMGAGTTLLVDTFNTPRGIINAVEVAGPSLGAIRIDSGDLNEGARQARRQLDALGAYDTKIIVTSDLDEFIIKDLAQAPIDGYGVGTKLVSTPPAGMVFKLVEVNHEPVAKHAVDKTSTGGVKLPIRIYDRNSKIASEITLVAGGPSMNVPTDVRPLLVNLMVNGERVGMGAATLEDIRAYHADVMGTLPDSERQVWSGDHGPFITAQPLEEYRV